MYKKEVINYSRSLINIKPDVMNAAKIITKKMIINKYLK